MLNFEVEHARAARKSVCIAGDFNSWVGLAQSDVEGNVVGPCAIARRNDRGSLLVSWCQTNAFFIANTFSNRHAADSWTYKNSQQKTQIDFVLLEESLRNRVLRCDVMPEIDFGSDHRPVGLLLSNSVALRKRRNSSGLRNFDRQEFYRQTELILCNECQTFSSTSDKAAALEASMIQAAQAARSRRTCQNIRPFDVQIRALIDERRSLKTMLDISVADRQARRKELGKELQKLQRQKTTAAKAERIESIVRSFKGLKKIAALKTPCRRGLIPCVVDSSGETQHDRKQIAEVFASFYENLYHASVPEADDASLQVAQIEPFNFSELRLGMQRLKDGKVCDQSGVCSEMLRHSSLLLWEMVLDLFNDVLQADRAPPSTWRRTRLVMIFKKGDERLPQNYRPIALVQVLYKLFSGMVCHRLQKVLLHDHSPDQAAYRPHSSTEDHIFTIRLLLEKCRSSMQTCLWAWLTSKVLSTQSTTRSYGQCSSRMKCHQAT